MISNEEHENYRLVYQRLSGYYTVVIWKVQKKRTFLMFSWWKDIYEAKETENLRGEIEGEAKRLARNRYSCILSGEIFPEGEKVFFDHRIFSRKH